MGIPPTPPGSKSHFARHLLPFLALVVGSFVGLAQFRKINYKYNRNDASLLTQEQLSQVGMSSDEYQHVMAQSLQKEYEQIRKNIDLDDWKNIRGPRPWENSKEVQENMRKESGKNN